MLDLRALDVETAETIQAWAATVSVALAFLGLFLVIVQVRNASKQHADNLRAQQKLEQPYLYVDVRNEPSWQMMLAVVIENTGNSVGMDGKVTFDPPIISLLNDGPRTIGTIPLSALPPGRRIHYWLGFTPKVMDLPDFPCQTTVNVSVKGPYGVEENTYTINFNTLRKTGRNPHPMKPITVQLKKIQEHVAKLPGNLGAIRTAIEELSPPDEEPPNDFETVAKS
jgi:hypothetical protein